MDHRARTRALPPVLRRVAAVTLLVVALAGCAEAGSSGAGTAPPTGGAADAAAGGAAGGASPSPTPSSASPSSPAADVLEVAVAGGQVQPPPSTVEVAAGEPLLLRVTSDVPDEFHAHGTAGPEGEVEVALEPGAPLDVALVWDQPGSYEVELHDQGLLLLRVDVR